VVPMQGPNDRARSIRPHTTCASTASPWVLPAAAEMTRSAIARASSHSPEWASTQASAPSTSRLV
jgi:hypothetical protein